MPKFDCISSDEEDEIWDYRSMSQKVRQTQSLVTAHKAAKRKTSVRSQSQARASLGHGLVKQEDRVRNISSKSKGGTVKKATQTKAKVKLEVTVNGAPDVKVEHRTGRCPVCQMPFALLSRIETCSWHVDQCLDVPYSSKNECSAGLECNNEIPSHYKKFRHKELARSHRKNETNGDRYKGDVDSAKTCLNFDARDTDPVEPGTSADCVIVIDSSQGSNSSQQLDADVNDSSTNCNDKSKKSETKSASAFDGYKEMFDEVDTVEDICRFQPENRKALDKNKNLIDKRDNSGIGEKILDSKRNSSDCELFNHIVNDDSLPDLEEETPDESIALIKVETVDISDDSHGSVEDIDDIADDTRSLSDMLNDALQQETETASDIDNNQAGVKGNTKQLIKSKRNADKGLQDDNNDVEDADDDDPIMSLFKDKSKKHTISAISSLCESEGSSLSSDTSTDWEILKTTLTQPAFNEKEKGTGKETCLGNSSGAQLYEESMKTPSKNKGKANWSGKNFVNEYSKSIPAEDKNKQFMPKRGFFANKMMQISAGFDEFDKNQTERRASKRLSQQMKKQDAKESCSQKSGMTNTDERNRNGLESPDIKKTDMKRSSSSTSENTSIKSKNKCTTKVGSPKKLLNVKQEPIDYEIVEKKPKIEIKPKTPSKIMTGKKGTKHPKIKEEKDVGNKQKSLESYFKSKGTKLEPVTIQTDSESSEDCESFNKRDRLLECCDKCTQEQTTGESNYLPTMNEFNAISRKDCSQILSLSDTSKSACRKGASLSASRCSSCTPCPFSVPNSEATSCKGCESSQSSLFPFNSQKCSSFGSSCMNSASRNCDNCSNKCVHGNESQILLKSSQTLQGIQRHIDAHVCSQQNSCPNCNQSTQTQTSSKFNQSPICYQHSQQKPGGQNRTNSQCNSLGSSTCSHHFNIENVCTMSQNAYTNLPGGFIINESGDFTREPVNESQKSKNNQSGPTSQLQNESSSTVSDIDVEAIQQIRKSATDILMASSRLLYSKNAKQNAGTSKNKGDDKSEKSSSRSELDEQNGSFLAKGGEKGWKKQRGQSYTGGSGTSSSAETSNGSQNVKRKCPFYKKIPDTCMTVDAFRYGTIPDCRAYILSHFHYDHYMGLNKQFAHPIYCSKVTGNLVKKKIGVDSNYINTIPLYTPTVVENVEVTFLEANHCPGAVLILFKLKSGKVYLHTGDFRASQAMEAYPQLQNIRIHTLYLDTTYCDPQYDFPAQDEVIQFTVKLALDALASNPKTLIVCGCYTIGKERIFTAIADELDCKICVTRDKKVILDCMDDQKLKQRISLRWEDSCLHVLPMNKINYQCLQDHLSMNGKKYTSVLGIEPTGWTHNKKTLSLYHIKPKVNKDNIKIYGVPYSEHSSYLEMKRFVQFAKPAKILPTVNNGNIHSRRKMEVIFEAWMEELQSQRPPVNKQSSLKGWTK